MEKRFLGSLRPTRRRDAENVVGRGGAFELVKKQVLTGNIGEVERLYREMEYEQEQAAAAAESGEVFDAVQLAGEHIGDKKKQQEGLGL